MDVNNHFNNTFGIDERLNHLEYNIDDKARETITIQATKLVNAGNHPDKALELAVMMHRMKII